MMCRLPRPGSFATSTENFCGKKSIPFGVGGRSGQPAQNLDRMKVWPTLPQVVFALDSNKVTGRAAELASFRRANRKRLWSGKFGFNEIVFDILPCAYHSHYARVR